MKANEYIHTIDDGRGNRDVFIDGKKIEHVMYADTKRGIVRVTHTPIKVDKYRKRVLTKTLRGRVEVAFK